MLSTSIALLLAVLLCPEPAPPRFSRHLLALAATVLLAWILTGATDWAFLLAVAVLIALRNLGLAALKDTAALALLRVASLFLLLLPACFWPEAANTGWWPGLLSAETRSDLVASKILLAGALAAIRPGGWLRETHSS